MNGSRRCAAQVVETLLKKPSSRVSFSATLYVTMYLIVHQGVVGTIVRSGIHKDKTI